MRLNDKSKALHGVNIRGKNHVSRVLFLSCHSAPGC